jgi:signal peptidase I
MAETDFWGKIKTAARNAWHFVWNGEGWLSWVVDIILAFVLIKFVVYPALGLVLVTSHPIVAVVSGSMEHDGSFDSWWESQKTLYDDYNITKEQFAEFSYKNGFNKGDLMILYSKKNIKVGDVAVFNSDGKFDPIIHRVVAITEKDGKKYYFTKGDHNIGTASFEQNIPEEKVIGKAIIRVPYLGWIKIGVSCLAGGVC